MKRLGFKKNELIFFLIISIISILPFFLVKYVPSLDGPQHLYTARLIVELIKGNGFISQFFTFNPIIVGNLSSLYLIAILMLVFPAWLAEKLFLTLYIFGLALSFRYFIRSVLKTDSLLYLLIFPFAFTQLFMMGFYNFSVAFIPFFLALGYLKKHETLGIREAICLAVLGLFIYVSHAIVFAFFGMIVFLQMIFDLFYPLFFKTFSMKGWMSVVKKYMIVLVAAVPALVLWGIYFISINGDTQNSLSVTYRPVKEILESLYKLWILVGFHVGQEAVPDTIIFCTLVAFVLLAIIPLHRYFPNKIKPVISHNADSLKWSFIVITLLFLTLFVPDRLVTGSMSVRLSILFYFGVITWISIRSYPKIIVIIGLSLILGAFTWHRFLIYQHYKHLNKEIAELEDAGQFIKPQTILFPINCSNNWTQLHFHCYLGVDKPLVNLKNPQATGQMPLMWNYAKMPNVLLGEMDQTLSGVKWVYGNTLLPPVSAEYIIIWKPLNIEAIEGIPSLINKINPYYTQTFLSKKSSALLLQINN